MVSLVRGQVADLMTMMMIFDQPSQLHRCIVTYPLAGVPVEEIKQRMLNWASQFSILLFLDNNNYPSLHNSFECLLAAGASSGAYTSSLSSLQHLHETRKDWLFGHISYDLRNVLEPKLVSSNPERKGFPHLHFFVPQTVCYINTEQTSLTIESFDDPALIYKAIIDSDREAMIIVPPLQFTSVMDKDSYLDTIAALRKHIEDGDCYEINFCNEGYCRDAEIEPLAVFNALNKLSPAPFAAYYRMEDKYMMCASPERYLRKSGDNVLSQPMKGTARRGADTEQDNAAMASLRNSIKEQAENVMIVDLVRNDLSRCCETGSIKVDEMFGIYTFPQVHQMVSTVSGRKKESALITDAIRYSFPMGSMTGAPKYKVMQLIDHYEKSGRGLFSGTVGYITPDGDFDFNVIIRSLFYNAGTRDLSYQTGGAITYDSNAEQEWDEMRLKAWAMERIFS